MASRRSLRPDTIRSKTQEVASLEHPAFALGVQKHGPWVVARHDNGHELELVDGELRKHHGALVDQRILFGDQDEAGRKGAERVPVAIAFGKIALGVLDRSTNASRRSFPTSTQSAM